MNQSADFVQTALILRIARACQAAGSVVVLYDHAITFHHEVEHVWNHPLSFGSINYILIRYFGDALVILNIITFLGGAQTQQVCEVYFFVQSWGGVLVLFLIQLTLQARIYALYRQSKKILALMVFAYLGEIAAMSSILGLLDAYSEITNEVLPGLYICANTQAPSFFRPYIVWLPVIIYDGILCLLALWRGFGSWKSRYRGKGSDRVNITDVLIKDNAGYFVCILLTCIVSVVIAQSFGEIWTEVSQEFPAPAEVVIGCRLILNLRSSLVPDRDEDHYSHEDAAWKVHLPLLSP